MRHWIHLFMIKMTEIWMENNDKLVDMTRTAIFCCFLFGMKTIDMNLWRQILNHLCRFRNGSMLIPWRFFRICSIEEEKKSCFGFSHVMMNLTFTKSNSKTKLLSRNLSIQEFYLCFSYFNVFSLFYCSSNDIDLSINLIWIYLINYALWN